MRQIKFRAQDVASNKWLYGDLRHHKNDVCIFEQGGTKGEQVKRDRMTENAVDGICISNGAECGASIESSAGMLFLQNNTLDVGDKVKIIIVRED